MVFGIPRKGTFDIEFVKLPDLEVSVVEVPAENIEAVATEVLPGSDEWLIDFLD